MVLLRVSFGSSVLVQAARAICVFCHSMVPGITQDMKLWISKVVGFTAEQMLIFKEQCRALLALSESALKDAEKEFWSDISVAHMLGSDYDHPASFDECALYLSPHGSHDHLVNGIFFVGTRVGRYLERLFWEIEDPQETQGRLEAWATNQVDQRITTCRGSLWGIVCHGLPPPHSCGCPFAGACASIIH